MFCIDLNCLSVSGSSAARTTTVSATIDIPSPTPRCRGRTGGSPRRSRSAAGGCWRRRPRVRSGSSRRSGAASGGRALRGHGVIAAVAERIAAQQAPGRENGAAQYAVRADRLHRVGRAGRVVLAAARQRRRDHPLVARGSAQSDRRSCRAHDSRRWRSFRRLVRPHAGPSRRPARRARCGRPPAPRARRARARRGARRRRTSDPAGSRSASAQNASRSSRLTGCARPRRRPCATPTARAAARRSRPSRPRRAGTRRARGSGCLASVPGDRRARTRRCATGARASGSGRPRGRPSTSDGEPLAALVAAALEHDAAGASAHRARKPWVRARLRFLGW